MLTPPDAVGVLRSFQAELRPDDAHLIRERDEELYQSINVVLGEVKRLRKIAKWAERLAKQRGRYDTAGCNWGCRNMVGLLHAAEAAKEPTNEQEEEDGATRPG